MTAGVLMATPCTKSLGGGLGGTSREEMRGFDASSKHQSQHRRPRQGEAKGLEVTGGLSVGKEEKKMKQFPVESSGR